MVSTALRSESARVTTHNASGGRSGRCRADRLFPLLVIAYAPSLCSAVLLLHHRNQDLRAHFGVDLDPHAKLAQLSDRLGEIDFAFVHVEPLFLELPLNVARGHGTV